MMMGIGFVRHP